MKLTSLLSEDVALAGLRVRIDRSIQSLHPRPVAERKRELHVSDFTAPEKEFCYRKVLVRYWRGGTREFTSLIQHDGKFREQKWHELLSAAGVVKAYQPEYRLGMLVGHPDWLLSFGGLDWVADLTGFDATIDPIARSRHLGMKKRQVILYNVMADTQRGVIIYENKASCEFKFIAVERNTEAEVGLTDKVALVSDVAKTLASDDVDELYLLAAMAGMPVCKKNVCRWCQVQEVSTLAEKLTRYAEKADAIGEEENED